MLSGRFLNNTVFKKHKELNSIFIMSFFFLLLIIKFHSFDITTLITQNYEKYNQTQEISNNLPSQYPFHKKGHELIISADEESNSKNTYNLYSACPENSTNTYALILVGFAVIFNISRITYCPTFLSLRAPPSQV